MSQPFIDFLFQLRPESQAVFSKNWSKAIRLYGTVEVHFHELSNDEITGRKLSSEKDFRYLINIGQSN